MDIQPPVRRVPVTHRFTRLLASAASAGLVLLFASCAGGSDSSPTGNNGGNNGGNNTVAPVANFTTATVAGDPLSIQFTDISTAGSSPITSRSWTFGDGQTSTTASPTHRYATAGDFTATLTVTTAVGSNSKSSTVRPTALAVAPIAGFSASVRAGEPGVAIQFTDTSAPGSASITSWAWTFGDGTSSSLQSPSKTYTALGFHTVTLMVTTTAGTNTATQSNFIEVYQRIIVSGAAAGADRPAIPTITQYNQSLPDQSGSLSIAQASLGEFRPILDSLRLTYWQNTRSENDCPNNLGTAVPANAVTGWLGYIPLRSGNQYNLWRLYTPNETFPGAFPQRITVYADPFGNAGGVPRWQGCEEMKPLFQDYYSAYYISFNQLIAQRPTIRRSRIWKKVGETPLGTSGIYSQSRTLAFGVENTTAYEFTASITASVTSITPTMTGTLSATLTAAFSSSVTVSTTSSTTDTYTAPANLPNYNQVFSLWQLVDVFTIEGATQGVLWSDPNYAVRNPQSQFRIESPTNIIAPMSIWIRVP